MQNIQKRIFFTLLACSLFGATMDQEMLNKSTFATESDRYKLIKLIKSLLDISAVILIEKQEAAGDSPIEDETVDASAEDIVVNETNAASVQPIVASNSKESQEDNKITKMIDEISDTINKKGLYYDQIANNYYDKNIRHINLLNQKLDTIYEHRFTKNNLTEENKKILEIISKIKFKIKEFDKTASKKDLTIDLIELLDSLTRYVYSPSDEKPDNKFNAAKQALRRTHKTIGILIDTFTNKDSKIIRRMRIK